MSAVLVGSNVRESDAQASPASGTDESWVIGGIRSPEHWLTCYAGVSYAMAADLVQVARRTESLPALARGLTDGELSIGRAPVIARYTPDDFDDDVVELARHATVPQLRRLLGRYEFAPDAGPQDIEDDAAVPVMSTVPTRDEFHPAVRQPQLQMHTHDGHFQLIYDAPVDIGALVQQAIVEAKDALFLADQPHVTLADGLTEVSSRSLENGADLSGGRASRRIFCARGAAMAWCNPYGRRKGHQPTFAVPSASSRSAPGGWSRIATGVAVTRDAKQPSTSKPPRDPLG